MELDIDIKGNITGKERDIFYEFLHQQEKWLRENNIKHIRLQVPIALKRTAKLFGYKINLDICKDPLEGIPYNKKNLSDMYGIDFANKKRTVDAIMFSDKGIVITEIKTNLTRGIKYDAGIGQLFVYREAFVEDCPLITRKVPIYALLLSKGSKELELVEDTLKRLQISLYDTEAKKFLVGEPFSSISDFVQRLQHMAEIVGKPEFELRNYDVALALAMQGDDESLAKARLILENIDPYKLLDPEDFRKFDEY